MWDKTTSNRKQAIVAIYLGDREKQYFVSSVLSLTREAKYQSDDGKSKKQPDVLNSKTLSMFYAQ